MRIKMRLEVLTNLIPKDKMRNKITNIEPETNPSIPSIKLMKFIIAVPEKVNKIQENK